MTSSGTRDVKPLRTATEMRVGEDVASLFEASADPVETRLENFPKYVRRQHLTRFLAMYEIFKEVLSIKGSVVECGVNRGYGLMTWAKLSAILEPNNLTRRVYGFDSFAGFPAVAETDIPGTAPAPRPGDLASDSFAELQELVKLYDADRFLGHVPKVELIKGDAVSTIPEFLQSHRHLVVSLLFLDFDLYDPTRAALEAFLPRMPAGAILAFDELDNPLWPGETMALFETMGIGKLRLERLTFDPYIAFARIG
jgi:hypothetical protein